MKISLLHKYWQKGGLDKAYFNGKKYTKPFSAEDRLNAGTRLYEDFMRWHRGHLGCKNYQQPRVDGGKAPTDLVADGRFQKALRRINPEYWRVVYKIVVEECEIKAPAHLSTREKLYFNDEIKGLLCRGLDNLCVFYQNKV